MTKFFQRSTLRPFHYNTITRMPSDRCGVYIFWSQSQSRAVYVGETTRKIRERIREHYIDSHNLILQTWIRRWPEDLQVCYVLTSERFTVRLEQRLIRRLDPQANDIGVW